MNVSLVAALVGTAAAVVGVPIAVLQLRQGRRHLPEPEVPGRSGGAGRRARGSAGAGAIRTMLPPPLGRLPGHVRGRGDVVGELTELASNPDGSVHVLTGLGGAGKSTVALAVAQKAASAGLRTWWVTGADSASVTQTLLGLAQRLGASTGEVDEALAGRIHAADVLWRCLEAAAGWVLVFDNVDDLAALAAADRRAGEAAGWLRRTQAGLVLVTSRIGDPQVWGPVARVHRVGSLDEVDGAQVLLDLAPDAGDTAEAARLSSRLGGLPLALHQAGAYLASPFAAHRTFEAYCQALEGHFGQLLGRGDEDRARVTGTWELSLTALAARGCPQARALLRVLSCFAPATPIPPSLLDLEILGRRRGGVAGAEEGLSGLLATGLIEVRGRPSCASVHPLVAETTRQRAGATALSASFGQAVDLLTQATAPLADEDLADRENWLSLLPHLRFLVSVEVRADKEVLAALGETAARAARALSWAGSYFAALELADTAVGRLAGLGQDSTAVLTLRFQRAIAGYYLGRYADAETELREVLVARQRGQGADHQDSLATQHFIAAAQAQQGRLVEAEALFRHVLTKRLDLLGPEHPHTLSSRHWIAAVAARQGMPEQAEAESLNVLDARLRTLGAEHPSTLATSHDVALYLADQGKHTQAETLFRQVLAVRSRVLAPDHPRTLQTQCELANSLAEQGKILDARSILEQTLRTQTEILGPSHPDTRRTAALIERAQPQESRQKPDRNGWFGKRHRNSCT